MKRRRSRMPVGTFCRGPLFVLLLILPFACGDDLRPDELECEEAVSHLQNCCPGYSFANVVCIYPSAGCGARSLPDIGEADSNAIRAKSCSDITSTGFCATASSIAWKGTAP